MEKKISIVIPNYNGKNLIARNLPQVIKTAPGVQIIIVDDASGDDSCSFIRKNFPKVLLIVNRKNQGFSKTVNTGVGHASADLVLLLNSDVSPRANFLKPLVEHFSKRSNLFAVAIADYSHENGKIILRGRGGATFNKGFVQHFAAKIKPGKTLWVSGGSGLFDRKKFLELGGFDPVFSPFYWEDIDLSYRAQKLGLICLFEPRSKVDHYHEEGAIKKNYSQNYVKKVSYRNQFLFVWKNISDYSMVLQHLAWMPYHFAVALAKLDLAFFNGFFWALAKLPTLVFNYELSTMNHQLTDKELLKKFAKP